MKRDRHEKRVAGINARLPIPPLSEGMSAEEFGKQLLEKADPSTMRPMLMPIKTGRLR